jgi:hypothetical protein
MSKKCIKLNNEKYTKRDSPPYHANDCPNQIKKGNDNLNYISIKDKNNIYKWKKYIDIDLPNPAIYKNRIYIGEDEKYYYSEKNIDGIYYWKELKIKMKKDIDDYEKQFPNYVKPDYDISFFSSNINDLTKDLKKLGILFYVLKWDKESLYAGHKSIIEEKLDEYLEKHDNYPKGYIYTSEYLLYKQSYKSTDDCIYLYHNIKDDVKDDLNKLLISYFPKRTIGLHDHNDAIKIYINEKKNLKPIKNHIMFEVNIEYVDKVKLSKDNFDKVHKYITKQLGKKYIYDLREAYNSIGSITLYYNVYIDKIKRFAKKFKEVKLPYLPKLKSIIISPNDWDEVGGNKKLMWSYKF